ncbi:MAG: hypothetical protein JWM95_1116 [Gemmatimonadetes bacterium]|nr:hypothetical protein [Gemmatimonadota bacterium]
MPGLLAKVRRKLTFLWGSHRERVTLSPLYSPDAADLDVRAHRDAAMAWLERAQDSGSDRGISYGVVFGSDFEPSYPETTGYICATFLEQKALTGRAELLERAIAMGDWEISIQLPGGAVMGGMYNTHPTPAVFNTGMVLLGWSALVRHTGEARFAHAARRAAEWLVSAQEPSGNWDAGNSVFAIQKATLYNVYAALGLCQLGVALGEQRYIDAAVRNAEYCASQQRPNGWFPDCCHSDPYAPLLHTLAYTMQGLIGIGQLTGRNDFIASAQRLADAQIRIMRDDGYLPGRQREDFSAAVDWCCLTGSAQTAIVTGELFLVTGDEKYRTAARTLNRYVMAHHDIRSADDRLRGGLAGSWPVWGDYGRLRVLNWATKFLVDALTLEERLSTA